MSKPVTINPYLTDEPSITPPSPGDALVRLIQIEGSLQGLNGKANAVPIEVNHAKTAVGAAKDGLISVLATGGDAGPALLAAQNCIREIYAAVVASAENPADATEIFLDLGFPDPSRTLDTWVKTVDLSTVTVTHFKPERQVMTTIAFQHAFGAEAYWLRRIIFFADQEVEENVVENFAPIFQRVRLPVGKHMMVIESRNQHRAVRTERFEIEVPAL
jgi:hypothetical protein